MRSLRSLLLLASCWGASAHASSCGSGTTIRLLSANAWGLPAPIARARQPRIRRIENLLDRRHDDVAGLQEVWRGALPHFHGPMHTVRTRGDSGLGLRSPHPIRGALLHRYRAERGFDAWKAKGILTARVDVPGRPLNVGVTHLQSGKGPKNAAVRGAQVAELLEQTERAGVWVLLGDFNFYDDEPIDTVSHTRLVEAGFVDVGQAAGAKRGTYPGMPDRFDRIYVRSACSLDATAEVIDGAGLSDHHFVAAELTL